MLDNANDRTVALGAGMGIMQIRLEETGTEGAVDTRPRVTSTPPQGWPYSFNVMAKPRGAICNLECDYCYFLEKERLYPGSNFRMSDAVLEEYVRQFIEAQRIPEATFTWQGGEPTLMGLPFYQRAVELQQKYRRPGMQIRNAFQTNGVLLDDAWCEFLARNHFLVGLSVDGPKPLHDAFRHDKGGKPSFDRVMRGRSFLEKHCVEYNILCTVHAGNAGHGREVYRFFRDQLKVNFIQLIPIVERVYENGIATNRVTERSISPEAFGAFVNDIFDEWVLHDVGRVYVQMFDVALAAWYGEPAGLCVFEETCGLGMALEHNGDLYACDHFVDPAHRLGNIMRTPLRALASTKRQWTQGQEKRDTLPRQCRECPVRFACNGGCPKDRFIETTGEEAGLNYPRLNYLCEGYRAFFQHIDRPMRMMVEELRAGRAPANVMHRLRAERLAGKSQAHRKSSG